MRCILSKLTLHTKMIYPNLNYEQKYDVLCLVLCYRPIPDHYINKFRMRYEINKLENIICVVDRHLTLQMNRKDQLILCIMF